MKQHALSAAFPAMSETEFEALVEDIRTNGQREAVITYQGEVLDGWHRYRACKEAGKKCVTFEHDGSDPIAFVLSRNLHRRHLTASQRAAAVVSATKWKPLGANQHGGSEAASDPELAAMAETTDRTIRHAKAAQRAGLGDAVRDGKVSAETAAGVAKLPARQRAKAVKAIEEGRKPLPTLPKKEDPRDARIAELESALEAAKDDLREAATTMRELNDQLMALETTDLDAQQQMIADLQKKIVILEGDNARLAGARDELQTKANELIRQVKRLQKATA